MLVWLSVSARCRFAYGPAVATATHWFYLSGTGLVVVVVVVLVVVSSSSYINSSSYIKQIVIQAMENGSVSQCPPYR